MIAAGLINIFFFLAMGSTIAGCANVNGIINLPYLSFVIEWHI